MTHRPSVETGKQSPRVAITGAGAIGTFGHGMQALTTCLSQPHSLFHRLPSDFAERSELPVYEGYIGSVPVEVEPLVARLEIASDRAVALGLLAANEAFEQAGRLSASPSRCGVYWGTSMAGSLSVDSAYYRYLVQMKPPRPTTVARLLGNSAAAQLAIQHGFRGPNQTFTIACAAAATAIGEGFHAIRRGRLDVALVGGGESMLAPGILAAWAAMRVLSDPRVSTANEACKPFGLGRSGLVLGEGAAAFLLEREDHARARGAEILAYIDGYGSSCDAHSIVAPHCRGQIESMQDALADAGMSKDSVDAINAHATGTPTGDVVEAEAINAVFGSARPAVTATKPLHGHLLGAAGAVEAAVCIASLGAQLVPPTIGATPIDPACGMIDIVTCAPRAYGHSRPLRAMLSNSFAFGGVNVTLVFRAAR